MQRCASRRDAVHSCSGIFTPSGLLAESWVAQNRLAGIEDQRYVAEYRLQWPASGQEDADASGRLGV